MYKRTGSKSNSTRNNLSWDKSLLVYFMRRCYTPCILWHFVSLFLWHRSEGFFPPQGGIALSSRLFSVVVVSKAENDSTNWRKYPFEVLIHVWVGKKAIVCFALFLRLDSSARHSYMSSTIFWTQLHMSLYYLNYYRWAVVFQIAFQRFSWFSMSFRWFHKFYLQFLYFFFRNTTSS